MPNREKTNTKAAKWIVFGLAIIVIGVGSYFGYRYYQNYLANKIYSINENIGFPDFNIRITKAEYKKVNLPIDQNTIKKYGSLNTLEDCNKESKENTYVPLGSLGNLTYAQYGPSDYNICVRRNDSRNAINKYSSENKQLVVNYKITALNNVNTSDFEVELIPDSGRQLDKQVGAFNANQFFPNGAQEKLESSLASKPVYTDESSQKYKPYYKSDIGNDINKGLERSGYLYTDIRNSESSVDLKVSYKSQTRIVRMYQPTS